MAQTETYCMQIQQARVYVTETRKFSGNGGSILLIHGIGASSRYYKSLIAALDVNATIFALDLPGFGSSSKKIKKVSVRDQAEYIRNFISIKKLKDPLLVGHSMGSQAIIELLSQNPSLCKKAVLVAPVVYPPERQAWRQILRLMQDSRHEPFSLSVLLAAEYLRCGIRCFIKAFRSMLTYDIEDKFSAIKAHVTLVRGEKDKIVPPDWVRIVASEISNSDSKEIRGAAHGVHYSHAAELAFICKEAYEA